METPEQARPARRRLRYTSLGLLVVVLLLMAVGFVALYFTQGCSFHLVHGHQVRLC